jgi:hypothetical protein
MGFTAATRPIPKEKKSPYAAFPTAIKARDSSESRPRKATSVVVKAS